MNELKPKVKEIVESLYREGDLELEDSEIEIIDMTTEQILTVAKEYYTNYFLSLSKENKTLAKLCEELDIPLWKGMELGKHFKGYFLSLLDEEDTRSPYTHKLSDIKWGFIDGFNACLSKIKENLRGN